MLMDMPTTPPSAIERKKDRGTTTELIPWHTLSLSLRERERERKQSLGCESSSRQRLFENTSAGTWSLDKVKALVKFVL